MDIENLVNRFMTRGKNPEGYDETNVRFGLNGHDVQIVHEEGSRYVTVFVDGTPSMMRRGEVERFLDNVE